MAMTDANGSGSHDSPAAGDRIATTETHSEVFIAAGQTAAAVTEKTTFHPPPASDNDMPLPTDVRTVFLGGLFFFAVLAIFYVAAELILPIVMAIVLKLLLQPLVRVLENLRVPKPLGALLAILLVLAVFGGAISVLAGPAAAWASKLPDAIPKLRDSLSVLHQPIDAVTHVMRQIEQFSGGESTGGSQIPAVKPAMLLGAVFSGTANTTAGLLTTLLVLFYLLVSGETFLRRAVEILPRFNDKRAAVELSMHIERDVSAYLLTVATINLVVGMATWADMWLCGVDSPVLWGAVAFMLNFVPILGPMVGMVIFLMASVLSLGVQWGALLPVGLYFGIHIIEGELATPMVLARRFTINPVAVILSLIFWYWMWGVAGAVLAVPMLTIIKIICDDLRPLRALGHLLEG
ncbi:MAG TPA: AI-2E family transporter [Rhodopila sp.]|uniref:AI-2E family transporter n=1 Tax=Rhodopila sp. TaxID=2480087 RepID=UPI002BA9093A|nr:AI-2E family transporter [Rhodopila sp.]HVY13647.1 AI-2E family transporter [Rhodopila sp.]